MIKRGLIILLTWSLMLLLPSFSLSDEVQIPYDAWPLELQAEYKAYGLKLDLSGNDRTEDSWGYLANEGSSYKIFTYRSITDEQFEIIKKITFEVEARHGQDNSSGDNS